MFRLGVVVLTGAVLLAVPVAHAESGGSLSLFEHDGAVPNLPAPTPPGSADVAPQPEVESTIPEDAAGYTLFDEWDQLWRRILDRGGRPEEFGAIQQRFGTRLYQEHELDQAVADFPLSRELEWREKRRNAVRWWIHSYDATELGNRVEVKLERAVSPRWTFGVRLDRDYTRIKSSDLVRLHFRYSPPGRASAPYLEIRVFPRIEKQDTDLELVVGYNHAEWGNARVRLFALDAFTNGSYFLASRREKPPAELPKQEDLPLALAAEFSSRRFHGLRLEGMIGTVVPHTTRVFTNNLEDSYDIRNSALLLGGLIEWRAANFPLWIGATGMAITSDFEREDPLDPARNTEVDEGTYQGRIYAFFVPSESLRFEGQVRYTERPEQVRFTDVPGLDTDREDQGWIANARTHWLISESVGLDLAFWHRSRTAPEGPELIVDGSGNRIVTRCLVRFGRLWASFGIGWEPNPRRSVYAGGGGTVSVDFD